MSCSSVVTPAHVVYLSALGRRLSGTDSLLSLVSSNRRGTKFIRNLPFFFSFFLLFFSSSSSNLLIPWLWLTLEYCKYAQLFYRVMDPFYEKCIFSSTVFLLMCFILFMKLMLSKRKYSNIASESPHAEHAQIREAIRKIKICLCDVKGQV